MSRSTRRAAALLIALVVASACSSSAKTPTLSTGLHSQAPLDSTVSSFDQIGGMRITGVATGPKGSKGPVTGVVDTKKSTAHITFPIFTTNGTRYDVEIIEIGDHVYVGRAAVDGAARAAFGIGQDRFLVRYPSEKRWVSYTRENNNTTRLIIGVFDLLPMLQRLATYEAVKSAQVGTSTIGGAAVTQYALTDVGILRYVAVQQGTGPVAYAGTGASVNLWIDGSHRVRKVSYRDRAGTIEYTLDQLGSPVSVTAPASADIGPFVPPSTVAPTP